MNNEWNDIIEKFKSINDDAVAAYTPEVEAICRKASQNEVELLLGYLLTFAGNEQMLFLYKKVCRYYFYTYPQTIHNHILEYRKEFDRESLSI